MRKPTCLIASTIDGIITGPDNGNPDHFACDGDRGEALETEYPEVSPTHVREMRGLADAPNRHFDTLDSAGDPSTIQDLAGLREDTEGAWVDGHLLRPAAAMAALICLCRAPGPRREATERH